MQAVIRNTMRITANLMSTETKSLCPTESVRNSFSIRQRFSTLGGWKMLMPDGKSSGRENAPKWNADECKRIPFRRGNQK